MYSNTAASTTMSSSWVPWRKPRSMKSSNFWTRPPAWSVTLQPGLFQPRSREGPSQDDISTGKRTRVRRSAKIILKMQFKRGLPRHPNPILWIYICAICVLGGQIQLPSTTAFFTQMTSPKSITLILTTLLLCGCQHVSPEDAQTRFSRRRAEEEQTVQAIRNSPIQPERTRGIESTDQLNRQQ